MSICLFLGAYLWTDQNDPNALSDEKHERYWSIGTAVNEPWEIVQKLLNWQLYYDKEAHS